MNNSREILPQENEFKSLDASNTSQEIIAKLLRKIISNSLLDDNALSGTNREILLQESRRLLSSISDSTQFEYLSSIIDIYLKDVSNNSQHNIDSLVNSKVIDLLQQTKSNFGMLQPTSKMEKTVLTLFDSALLNAKSFGLGIWTSTNIQETDNKHTVVAKFYRDIVDEILDMKDLAQSEWEELLQGKQERQKEEEPKKNLWGAIRKMFGNS